MADVVTVWNPFIITNKGLDLRQEAIATGKSVKFDYAKIGQGVPSLPSNIPLMTDVVMSAHQVPVVRSESNGVTHFVGVRIDNKEFPQPVLMREIGLFASLDGGAPILYGYTYTTQGYDSVPAGSVSHYIWTVGIDTVLSRAQSITFVYDGSTVYASYEDIDKLIQAWEDYKTNSADTQHDVDRLYKLHKLIPLETSDYDDSYFPIMPIDGGQLAMDLSAFMAIDGDLFTVPYADNEHIDAEGFDAEYFGYESGGGSGSSSGGGLPSDVVLDGGSF